MTDRQSAAERVASLEQRLTDHESRCEERLIEIRATARNTLAAVEGLKGRFWTITLALLAWALAQVWSANQVRVTRLEALHPAIVQEAANVSAH